MSMPERYFNREELELISEIRRTLNADDVLRNGAKLKRSFECLIKKRPNENVEIPVSLCADPFPRFEVDFYSGYRGYLSKVQNPKAYVKSTIEYFEPLKFSFINLLVRPKRGLSDSRFLVPQMGVCHVHETSYAIIDYRDRSRLILHFAFSNLGRDPIRKIRSCVRSKLSYGDKVHDICNVVDRLNNALFREGAVV